VPQGLVTLAGPPAADILSVMKKAMLE